MSTEDGELDPRIQIELENLNSATDEINKLEIELEEANSTFRILMNESTRRLTLSAKKLGNCIEKARPYHDAVEKLRQAQIECQKTAVKFQRANEIHATAKETVTLAENRFMSNSHEWQFDNAWQEMLNHATQKVMEAEKQKAECHEEHQRRTKIFHAAEQTMQQLEERFRRNIAKSRPYFEEKQICYDQLAAQKARIEELQAHVQTAKSNYSTALRNLERISDDIHRQRGDYPQMDAAPTGPREPGVGAELNSPVATQMPTLPNFQMELDKCDHPSSMAGSQMSLGGHSMRSSDFLANSNSSSNKTNAQHIATLASMEDSEIEGNDIETGTAAVVVAAAAAAAAEKELEELRQKVKMLAVRPIEGGDGQQQQNAIWEHELKTTVDKLDQLMLMKECARKTPQNKLKQREREHDNVRPDSLGAEANKQYHETKQQQQHDDNADVVLVSAGHKNAPPIIQISTSAALVASLPATPEHGLQPIKKLQKLEPLPSANSSMRELPLLSRLSNEILDRATRYRGQLQQRRRSLE